MSKEKIISFYECISKRIRVPSECPCDDIMEMEAWLAEKNIKIEDVTEKTVRYDCHIDDVYVVK